MKLKTSLAIAILVLPMAACSTTEKGAGIGAVGGAILGGAITGDVRGAAIGAAGGGVTGAIVGNMQDRGY